MKKIFTPLLVFISLSAISQTSYYVNDNSQAGDVFTSAVGNDLNAGTAAAPFATIAKAYQTAALTGDIIYVDAGTYNNVANGPLSKSLTFRGANYLVSPNDLTDPLLPNGGRNAETIITNTSFTIAASNVTFSGFLFNPGNAANFFQFVQQNTTLDFDNITISKNIFRNTSGNASILLRGKNITPLVSFNYSVLDNRLIKEVNTAGTSVVISGVDGVQIQNNTFTVSTDIANRTEADISISSAFRSDNVVISHNTAYRQNNLVSAITSLHTRIEFNKAIECNRFSNVAIGLSDPTIVDITDNIVTDSKGGASSIGYQRNNGFNLSSPNIARIERNTVTINCTGLTTIPQSLISASLNDNTQNSQVYIRDNKLSFSGSFSSLVDPPAVVPPRPPAFISGIYFLNNSRQAVVERNEIEFNASNYNATNKNGIYVLHYNLQPGTNFGILNNKVSGFPTSLAIQQNDPLSATDVGAFGQLPDWVTVNAQNNSFTNDVLSINNGTNSTEINASCNWWGSATAQNLLNKISGNIQAIPWLTNGTDNDIATGFQPVANSCDGYPTLVNLDSYTNVTCNGANNGAINITATYGKAPTVFTWTKDGNPGFISHDEDPTNLSPGTYHLALVDGNGSNIYITDTEADGPGTIDVTITQPPLLVASAEGTDVDCNGNSTGSATVNVSGGTGAYSYLWSNGETTSSINNLIAGNYTVTVTDDHGCIATSEYEVTEPDVLSANNSGINVDCNGNSTGSSSVNVSGGTEPYSYLWSNGATTDAIENLIAGNYSVTVTDAHGCMTTSSIEITQPTILTAVATGTSTSCANSATVTTSGGTTPYSYLWNNGATTQSISSIAAGTYSVTITDAHGCQTTAETTVTANEAFNPSASVVDVTCNGASNGSITVTNANATAPFQFSIDGVTFYPGSLPYTFSNLAAGTYTISVKDNNGCTGFVTKTINQPPALTAVINSIQTTCFGMSTGSISVTTGGGTGGLSHSWTGPSGYTSSQKNISNLAAGIYSLTVTDGNGCTTVLNAAVPSYNEIIVNAAITNVSCRGTLTGAINLSVSGGSNSGFTYSWTGNITSTNEDISNLASGNNYNVAVTDIGSGCVVNASYSITQPASNLSLSATKTNASGCNSMGTITATGSGGTPSYQYSLDGTNYQPSGSFTGLIGGNYTVWVKDANGCTATKALSITDNGTDEFEGNNSKAKANSISIGTIISARIGNATDVDWYKFTITNPGNYTITLSHPSSSIIYEVSAATGTPAPVLSGNIATLGIGTYYITVSGGAGSYFSLVCYQFSVSAPASPSRASVSKPQQEIVHKTDLFELKAYPNPSASSFRLQVESASDEKIGLRIMDVTGRLIEERKGLQPKQIITLGEKYIKGIYLAEIIQGIKRKTVKLVKL